MNRFWDGADGLDCCAVNEPIRKGMIQTANLTFICICILTTASAVNRESACLRARLSTRCSQCDRGRILKAQYDAAQAQLKQQKASLEKIQEEIRRKGYGKVVYDPDSHKLV